VVETLRTSVDATPQHPLPGDQPAEGSVPVTAPAEVKLPGTGGAGSSTELLELVIGKASDAPLCFTCGTKMRPSGACYVCEGCGSTSGCS
jgi:ribonucleoside-diphosphate reductase alpha chain